MVWVCPPSFSRHIYSDTEADNNPWSCAVSFLSDAASRSCPSFFSRRRSTLTRWSSEFWGGGTGLRPGVVFVSGWGGRQAVAARRVRLRGQASLRNPCNSSLLWYYSCITGKVRREPGLRPDLEFRFVRRVRRHPHVSRAIGAAVLGSRSSTVELCLASLRTGLLKANLHETKGVVTPDAVTLRLVRADESVVGRSRRRMAAGGYFVVPGEVPRQWPAAVVCMTYTLLRRRSCHGQVEGTHRQVQC